MWLFYQFRNRFNLSYLRFNCTAVQWSRRTFFRLVLATHGSNGSMRAGKWGRCGECSCDHFTTRVAYATITLYVLQVCCVALHCTCCQYAWPPYLSWWTNYELFDQAYRSSSSRFSCTRFDRYCCLRCDTLPMTWFNRQPVPPCVVRHAGRHVLGSWPFGGIVTTGQHGTRSLTVTVSLNGRLFITVTCNSVCVIYTCS
jgi:hypothetical protein